MLKLSGNESETESETTLLLFCGSLVVNGLENSACGYIARQVIKDMRENLRNPMGTYLPQLVEKLTEEFSGEEKKVREGTVKVIVNLLFIKIRNREVEEEEENAHRGGSKSCGTGRTKSSRDLESKRLYVSTKCVRTKLYVMPENVEVTGSPRIKVEETIPCLHLG